MITVKCKSTQGGYIGASAAAMMAIAYDYENSQEGKNTIQNWNEILHFEVSIGMVTLCAYHEDMHLEVMGQGGSSRAETKLKHLISKSVNLIAGYIVHAHRDDPIEVSSIVESVIKEV